MVARPETPLEGFAEAFTEPLAVGVAVDRWCSASAGVKKEKVGRTRMFKPPSPQPASASCSQALLHRPTRKSAQIAAMQTADAQGQPTF